MEGDSMSGLNRGIIPRAIEALFEGMSAISRRTEFTITVSFVEIYFERIHDLLDELQSKDNLAVREDKLKGIFIAGVTEVTVSSAVEVLQLIRAGSNRRVVKSPALYEDTQCRAHGLLSISLEQQDIVSKVVKHSKLTLVDLASSCELAVKSKVRWQEVEEAKAVNRSLFVLAQVINALSDPKQAPYIPYRDSKLTRLLQDSLGGNAKTLLILVVARASNCASDTLSTLRFGARAKCIENQVSMNHRMSVREYEALLLQSQEVMETQNMQIHVLLSRLQAYQAKEDFEQAVQSLSASSSSSQSLSQSSSRDNKASKDKDKDKDKRTREKPSKKDREGIVFQKIQEYVKTLEQQVKDLQDENAQQRMEVRDLHRNMQTKERIYEQMSITIKELQRNHEMLREKNESLLRENGDMVQQVQSLSQSMSCEREESSKHLYKYALAVDLLNEENSKLQSEIDDLSRDYGNNSRLSLSSLPGTTGDHIGSNDSAQEEEEGNGEMVMVFDEEDDETAIYGEVMQTTTLDNKPLPKLPSIVNTSESVFEASKVVETRAVEIAKSLQSTSRDSNSVSNNTVNTIHTVELSPMQSTTSHRSASRLRSRSTSSSASSNTTSSANTHQ